MEFDIRKFDSYREDNRREVKKAKGGLPASLWETYSSFANCYGGIIILGVAENADGSWRATGLQNESKIRKDFWDTINNKSKVSHNILTDSDIESFKTDDGSVILVIQVPKASRDQKPIYINGDMFNGSFRRNWEGDYHCTREEVLGMLRDEPQISMDAKILEDWSISDLNKESVQAYRNLHRSWRPGHVWEMLGDEEYLKNIGAAAESKTDGKMHPTAAGLLMFGNEYDIVREFPHYFLDYREVLDPTIRWTDRLQSSSGDWSGNLFDFFFRVNSKLVKDVKIPFVLEGAMRVDDTPVHHSIREALANCLVNTDFYLSRGVVIKKDAETIVFENPGSIRTGKAQMLRGGISDPRNASILKMLNLIGIGERAGSGVPDIFATWEQQGWKEPGVEEQYGPDRTILTLSFIKKVVAKSNNENENMVSDHDSDHVSDHVHSYEDQKQRLQDFCAVPRTRQEMQDFLGIASRGYFSRRFIVPMVNEGKLKLTIPDKPKSRNQKYIKA
ncbi:MAG: putative DNA binding domain-containing protein [Lachnospiraceae bacterium]|nr:putative DNA binding domain-containing protein [Lachnospiraceae bacterium]